MSYDSPVFIDSVCIICKLCMLISTEIRNFHWYVNQHTTFFIEKVLLWGRKMSTKHFDFCPGTSCLSHCRPVTGHRLATKLQTPF